MITLTNIPEPEPETPPTPWKKIAAATIGLIFIVSWAIGSLQSFKDCEHQRKTESAYNSIHEQTTPFRSSIDRLSLHIVCVKDAVHESRDDIAALSTLVIALSTVTLWLATRRLWQSSQRQLTDFQRSLRISERQATHMEAANEVARRTADAARDLVKTAKTTAERQLRAYIFVDDAIFEQFPQGDAGFPHGMSGYINVSIKNYGQTPAINALIKTDHFIEPEKDKLVIMQFSERAIAHPKVTIAPGHAISLRLIAKAEGYHLAEWAALGQAGKKGYLIGRVDYLDAFGKQQKTTFQMICHFGAMTSFALCENGNDAS
jgi:hypothetical protein